MSRMELRLGLPTGSWLGDVSRAQPDARFRVTGAVAVDGGDVTALSVAGSDRDRAIAALRDHEHVTNVSVIDRRGAETATRVTGRPPSFTLAARQVGVPIESTVAVVDGVATMPVAGERTRLTAFGRRLAAEGVRVGIDALEDDGDRHALTDAQRDLVLAAVDAGYYDTPRDCTLTELAADRGIAKSTCSETLHRAEGRILRWFVDGVEPFGTDDGRREEAARGDDDRDGNLRDEIPRDENPRDENVRDGEIDGPTDAEREAVEVAATEP